MAASVNFAPQFVARGVVLSGSLGAQLLYQCSRDPCYKIAPSPWTPAPADIRAMQQAAAPFFKAYNAEIDPRVYRRGYVYQFTVYTLDGHKLVYINALPDPGNDKWRTVAEVVCDGGTQFWGCVYDIKTHAFSRLEFNGGL